MVERLLKDGCEVVVNKIMPEGYLYCGASTGALSVPGC